MAGAIGVIGPLIGPAIGAIGSIFGGGKGQTTQPTNPLPNIDQTARSTLGGIGGLGQNNVPQQLLPQYNSVVSGLQSNPYSTQAQQGANAAAGQGAATAGQSGQASSDLFGLSNSMIPFAQQLGIAAFDPQQGLYNRTLQQVTDQQRVAQGARGVQNTPYGASLEGDATRNFNIDWQNNLLSRMLSGGQGLQSLLGAIGGGYNQAGNLGANASALYGQSAAMPYQTFFGQGQDQLGLLDALSKAGLNANAVPQQQIQDWLQYLGAGNASNQTAANSQAQNFQQNQTLGSGLGSALGQVDWTKLGNFFGGLGGSAG